VALRAARNRAAALLVAMGCLTLAGCKEGGNGAFPTPVPTESEHAAQTVVIIHGVGNHEAGYSKPIQALLELRMGQVRFSEVLWSDLGTFLLRTAAGESPELRRAKEDWQAELTREEARVLTMRSPNLDTARVHQEYEAARGYVGPILQYEYLSREERRRIQARLREALQRAVGTSDRTHLVAHSLGSVIAFDVLHGWEGGEAPLQLESFVTLGSPLNKSVFRSRNGRPTAFPPTVREWVNVFSPWDPISSALAPSYGGVGDRKIETSILPLSAHSAYWTHPDVIGLFPAGPQ